MKKLLRILVLMVALVCLSNLFACSTAYGNVEKALTDNGYKVVERTSDCAKMESESEIEVKGHCFYSDDDVTYVVVYEFNKTDDMKSFIQDSQTAQGFIEGVKTDGTPQEVYNSLEQKGYANGNCLVVPIGLNTSHALEITKKA